MRDAWGTVRDQLSIMADSIPDRGWFHIDAFSDQVISPIRNQQVTSSTRAQLSSRARLVPAPIPGGRTDIGRALETAADEMQARRTRGLGRVTFLFVITDGAHYPPPGARYSDSAAWQVLKTRWAVLDKKLGSQVIAYAVPIDSGGAAGSRLVASVIPNAIVLPPLEAKELGDVLSAELSKARKDLLRTRVEREVRVPSLSARLSRNPQSVALFRPQPVPVWLRSTAACVTYRLPVPGEEGPQEVLIRPGDSVQIHLPVRNQLALTEAFPWSSGRTDTLEAATSNPALAAGVPLAFEPHSELLDLNVKAPTVKWTIPVEGVVAYQPMGYWVIVVPGLLLLAIVIAVRRKRLPPDPGHLEPTKKAPANVVSDLRLNSDNEYELHVPTGNNGGKGTIVVRFEREAWWRSPGRVHATVRVEGGIRAAVAQENDVGKMVITEVQDGERHALPTRSYVIWRTGEQEEEWTERLSEGQLMNRYAGVQWEPSR